MPKTDFKKKFRNLYSAPTERASIIDIPGLNFITVDGSGHPNEQNFQNAASTVYPAAYILKFMIKERNPENDYVVMPMEVKWEINRNETGSKRFKWKMMIMQPDFTNEQLYLEAVERAKRKTEMPCLDSLKYQRIEEGLCAQIFHKGPYGNPMEETFTILKENLKGLGYEYEKDSHDIYFNDVRKTDPEKLKTLIRVKIFK